ncbi:MAG: 50S ribosomal protein L18 [Verrucomicrobiota bacterium]
MPTLNRKAVRAKVHRRIRKKISGTAERPRLAVHFSNKNVYAQLIDDESGKTLAAASTKDSASKGSSSANKETATSVGKLIAERAKAAKIETVVFDRGGHIFHGKVKALADAAREGGLQF